MTRMKEACIGIMATDGFEKSELFEPRRLLEAAGATVLVIAPEAGSIRSWDRTDWGESIAVDETLDTVHTDDFHALVLPGGALNPDRLRTVEKAVAFVRDFSNTGKPLAAICHAPWLLIEAGIVAGRTLTSYHSIRTDVQNAGGRWQDAPVVVDEALITSRNPGDIEAFVAKIVEEVREGVHQRAPA